MELNLDAVRLSAVKPTKTKQVRSFSIDQDVLKELVKYCQQNNLSVSPIIENLITQFLQGTKETT